MSAASSTSILLFLINAFVVASIAALVLTLAVYSIVGLYKVMAKAMTWLLRPSVVVPIATVAVILLAIPAVLSAVAVLTRH